MDRSKKRATSDEPIFLDSRLFDDLVKRIDRITWPYKTSLKNLQTTRDKALFALLILTGLRISEAIALKRKQFREYKTHIELANVHTLKRGLLRKRILLPRTGRLGQLTYYVQDWLDQVPEQPENYIFASSSLTAFNFNTHINRHRAYQTIALSGLFPHYARAVCETVYVKLVFKNDAYKLKEFMGLKRLESTSSYVAGSWQENEKEIFKI